MTRKPSCAMSALSMLRTVFLGATRSVVSTWISSIDPDSPGTIRTDNTPGRVAINSSARRIGSTLPAIEPEAPENDVMPKLTGMDRIASTGDAVRTHAFLELES